jgi:transcriptional regulator with XRE-family HTH domain
MVGVPHRIATVPDMWKVSGVPRDALSADKALCVVLRRIRTERGLSQEDVAFRAGITTGSYARIELWQASPTWATVRQIAGALDLSMEQLGAAVDSEPDHS